jgi:hypothetical protein
MGHVERFLVRSRFMNIPGGASPDPAQQFAQHHRAHAAKNDHRPGFPHQDVDKLVELRMGHATKSSNFAA